MALTYYPRISYQGSAAIRDALKLAFPEFRFSVRKSGDDSMVHVRITSGPEDLGSLVDSCSSRSMIAYDVAQVDFDYIEKHRNVSSWLIRPTQAHFEEYQDLLNAVILVIQRAIDDRHPDWAKQKDREILVKYTLGIGRYLKPYEIRYPHKGIYQAPASYLEQARAALAFTQLAA